MSQTQSWIILFVLFLGVTAFCSYIGDDDVVYRYLDRKPTSREGIVRIRWVILKTLAAIYGGGVLEAVIGKLLIACCSIVLLGNPAALTVLVCIALVGLLIGVLQNGIRRLRGRPTRPLIDPVVWRRNFRGPIGRRR